MIRHYLRQHVLRDKNISIISNNCMGGLICHEYDMKFLSPTVNLQFPYMDFVYFCNSLREHINMELKECPPLIEEFSALGGGDVDFPCGILGDVRILFQHYKSFQEAQFAWSRRCKRILYDRIFVLFYTQGVIDEQVLNGFKSIKYHKIMLSDQKHIVNGKDILYFSTPDGKEWWEIDNKHFNKRYYYDRINWCRILNRISWD